jgi:hypothetical protein
MSKGDFVSLPRISSAGGKVDRKSMKSAMTNVLSTFSYLHSNIKEETLKDPMFNMMPILKNIARRNLIPTIDFEEFN